MKYLRSASHHPNRQGTKTRAFLFPLLMVLTALLFAGCSGSAKKRDSGVGSDQTKASDKPTKPENLESAATGKASGTRFAIEPPQTGNGAKTITSRKRLWKINWEAANILFANGGLFSGQMRTVTGEIFELGSVTATFSSEMGEADKASNRLNLTGSVRIISVNKNSVLTAERVDWIPEKKLIRASGNVIVEGPWGIVGPVGSLLSNPDLTRIGSPGGYSNLQNTK